MVITIIVIITIVTIIIVFIIIFLFSSSYDRHHQLLQQFPVSLLCDMHKFLRRIRMNVKTFYGSKAKKVISASTLNELLDTITAHPSQAADVFIMPPGEISDGDSDKSDLEDGSNIADHFSRKILKAPAEAAVQDDGDDELENSNVVGPVSEKHVVCKLEKKDKETQEFEPKKKKIRMSNCHIVKWKKK
ncbi:hypothetical protein HELRODRAFT_178309 [Helobdella robusta]|uniref:Uncharacterized protein n=1 Tax=Helobdella robusta TaxID=6412 RepID=T1FD23_HELRO|nr:hypothetical protein HELRODRAFT_178309 [Helobdella robusta]ESN97194.1 hypothetical protein HELRODRAFT_178309 [Helobdella robusta]